MPIYKKDGTLYTLSTPNPLMSGQEVKEEWFITHNLDRLATETLEYTEKRIKRPAGKAAAPPAMEDTHTVVEKVVPSTPVVPQRKEPVVERPVIVEPPPVEDVASVFEEAMEPEPERERIPDSDKVLCYCLPAKRKERYDDVYGETRVSLSYGDKFSLEAVPVQRGDMKTSFWTSIMISTSSILYSVDDRRWWRVMRAVMQDNGGFVVECVPSADKPSFDD